MDAYSVYKHTAPSGRVYIGVSKNPEKRWNRGRGYMYNPYFWRCIQKYGWDNIKHEILFSGVSLESAKAKEVELIAELRANEREFGYNISGGGDGLTAEELMESCKYNCGFTYTNQLRRRAVVLIGPTSSGDEFQNTFVHEVRHLADAIAKSLGVPLDSERPAYISGDTAKALAEVICELGCR